MGGTERYYQIARCFRDEDFRADRQPEFTQLDLEMGFVEEEDVYHAGGPAAEGRAGARRHRGAAARSSACPTTSVMLRYGSDRPDRRLGVEIDDLTDVFRGSEFKVFSGAVESGGVVRAIKAGGEWPRSRFDALTERAQSLGAKGLAWARGGGGRLALADRQVPLRGRDAPAPPRRWAPSEGDAILIVADRAEVAARVLGALRVEVSRRGARAATTSSGSPTSRCSSGTRRRGAGTRCTTRSPSPSGDLDGDPGTWRSRAYDVVLDGWELGGGSIRINRPDVQQKVFDALGIGPEEAEERFGFLLEALPLRRAAARRHRASGSTASWRCSPAASRSAT